jgi:glycine/D-amino acid oxidase-like deaminating enzyme
MIAPAVARIIADAVTGVATDETLTLLDHARFEENRTVPEPQLV